MTTDFLDIINNNIFLKKIFPNGFPDKVGLVKLIFGPDSKSSFCLEVTEKPDVAVKKWGVWNKDYNAMLLYFYGETCGIMVERFDLSRNCIVKIYNENGFYVVNFSGENVSAKINFQDIFYEKGVPVFYVDYT